MFKNGRTVQSELFSLKIIKNSEIKIGVIISRKISKKAVIRNQIKRRISEICRLLLKDFKDQFIAVILTKPIIIERDFEQIKAELILAFRKVSVL